MPCDLLFPNKDFNIIVIIFIVYAEELYKQLYPGRLVEVYLSRDEFQGKIIQTIFVFLSISIFLGFVVL